LNFNLSQVLCLSEATETSPLRVSDVLKHLRVVMYVDIGHISRIYVSKNFQAHVIYVLCKHL